MLGLLEGMGKGTQELGKALEKSALQEAEERRQMNLLNIKRTWDREDKEIDRTNYNADQIAGETRQAERADSVYDKTIGDKRKDTEGDREFQLERDKQNNEQTRSNAEYANSLSQGNKSELEKNLATIASDKSLSEEKRAMAIDSAYKISKESSITVKDMAKIKIDALAQAQKEAESSMDDKVKTPAAIDARANEIFNSLMPQKAGLLEGGGNGSATQRPPATDRKINETAAKLAVLPQEEIQAALQSQKGVLSQPDIDRIASATKALQGKKELASNKGFNPETGQYGELNEKRIELYKSVCEAVCFIGYC